MNTTSHTRQLTFAQIIRSFFWLHLSVLVVIILQPSTPATYLGRYSKTAMLVLGVFVLAMPMMWLATRWLANHYERFSLNRMFSVIIVVGCGIVLFVMWSFHIGPTVSYIMIRMYATMMVLGVAIWAIPALELSTKPTVIIAAVVLIAVIIGLFVLATKPFPGLRWVDEGFLANSGYSFATLGQPIATMYQPYYWETYSLGSTFFMGVWFKAFGLTLSTARTYILAMGFISIAIAYWGMRQVYSRGASLLAVVIGLFAMSRINYVYKDIEVMVLMAVAFALYIRAEKYDQHWLHLLVGFVVGFSSDGHPIAFRLSFCFGFAYLLEWALAIRFSSAHIVLIDWRPCRIRPVLWVSRII